MQSWWEEWPGRLECELAELKEAGIYYELDEKAFEKGIVVLNVYYEIEGRTLDLVVIFPDVYPYMRFEIYAPGLNLDHHQNPFMKNLCMIGRSTANWYTTDTVAKYITSRLPKVIQTGKNADPTVAKQLEEAQGEPISHYYPYAHNHVVLVDSSWTIDPSIDKGFLKLGIDRSELKGLHCAVLSVMDRNKNILAEAESEITNTYPNVIDGKWIRSQQPILENDRGRFFKRLETLDRSLNNPNWHQLPKRKICVIGVLFPEEIAWREEKDGWLFFILQQGSKRKF